MHELNLTPAPLTDLQSTVTAYRETFSTPHAAISRRMSNPGIENPSAFIQ